MSSPRPGPAAPPGLRPPVPSRDLRTLVPVLGLLLGGCALPAVGPDHERPQPELPAAYGNAAERTPTSQPVDWWTLFEDPELDDLIRRVDSSNHELGAAWQRIEQARAVARLGRAEGRPAVALEPSYQRSRASDEVETFPGAPTLGTRSVSTVPLTLNWELDLFGRVRRATEAAVADAEASAADYEALRLLLQTEAATNYLSIRALDREIDAVRRSVATRRDSLELVRTRFDLGAVSELDVARAETLLASGESDLAGLERERSALESALATLIGAPASGFAVPVRPLSGRPPEVPVGLPSELLRARPDIRRAERRVAAANARIGVAVAAFYPSFSLTGDLGQQASSTSDLFDARARIWSIRPQLYLPLFQGGRNHAELERARARYEELLEDYQQSVLAGIADVETALAAWKHLAVQGAAQSRAVAAARRASDLALARYEAGAVDYLGVLDAERTALDAERSEARLIGAEHVDAVQLLRALGGRW